jgi:hypothetical protein
MKKILFFITMISAGLTVSAQLTSSAAANMKTMTIEEANRLNGTAQPTINGKPYSQYKAEQDALKQKNATPAAAPANQLIAVTPADASKVAKTSLPELTAEQQRKIEAIKADLTKNWAPRDPNEDPNKPRQAISDEALKQRIEMNKTPDAAQQPAVAATTTATPINKPVMAGMMQKGTAPATVTSEANKVLDNLSKSQGVEAKPAEEVKATSAKLEAKATKD